MKMLPPLAALVGILLGAAACTTQPRAPGASNASSISPASLRAGGPYPSDQNVPDFAKRPFEPFSRANAVAIALREWRAFGSQVNDDPPNTRVIPDELRADKQPGMWQRVGEYWWLGQDANRRQNGWTGKYDEWGTSYVPGDDGHAWSAAFISYVMRTAGAGDRFRYSPLHAEYINAAVNGAGGMQAYPASSYAPQVGDLVCTGRGAARNIRFADLPTGSFPSHCDLVVDASGGQLTVVGGNVDAAVTVKHLPVTANGIVADPRYNWFVVLQLPYDA